MMTAASRQIRAAGSPVRRFFAWWLEQLRELLPAMLRQPDSGPADLLLIRLHDGQLHLQRQLDGQWSELGRLPADTDARALDLALHGHRSPGQSLVVRLPEDAGLHRRVELPLAAEQELHQVLAYQLDSLSPYPAGQIYFSYRIARRDPGAGKLTVDLYLAPRKRIDQAIKQVEELGLAPDVVDFRTGDELDTPLMNLLPGAAAPGTGRRRTRLSRLNRWLLLLNAGLLIAVTTSQLLGKAARVERLETQVETARLQADVAIRLRRKVGKLEQENSFLQDRRQGIRPMLTLLDELTRILPDGTWLVEVRLDPREIRLYGLSSQATTLISEIENSPLFEQVTFQAPVVQDERAGGERFQIRALITRPGDGNE